MDGLYALIPLAALSIPIVAILSKPLHNWLELKRRQMELAATTAGEAAAQYAARIERLEQRVQVLERIATDRGQDLALEIERLRPAALN